MAEQTEALAQEPEEGATEDEKPAGPKGPLIPPMVVRGAIVGGILAVLAVGAILLVTDVIAPRIHAMGAAPAPGPKVEKVKEDEPAEVITVSDLIVNPASTGGRRYLKLAAAIEVRMGKKKGKAKAEGAEGKGEASLQEAQIRDLLIRELSARTLEELTDPTAKEEMRQTILAGLNDLLGQGKVTNLYFTEYVVQ
jgi:flagellar protein FliL